MRPSILLVSLVSAAAAAAPIDVWTKSTSEVPKRQRVDPEVLDVTPQRLADPQYGPAEKRWYRALPLETVFKVAPPTGNADLALLRFENGMAIPVRATRPAELGRLRAFIAVATSARAPDQGGQWSSTFEKVTKPGAGDRDRRPLEFHGNKLVVESGWHPMVAADAAATFNPWAFADTLVSIEYVNEAAWFRQFDPTDAAAKPGAQVFRGRCQFCHGVSNVGASYGWDFVEPYPAYKHRAPGSLTMHVKYREQDAPEKALMMPGFHEMKKPDVEAAWKWLEAMGTQGLFPYRAQ